MKENPKKIYLACPYSHIDPEVRERRFQQANRAAAYLMAAGHVVFSPISHSHVIDPFLGLQDHDFWLRQDSHYIDFADEICVLTLDGWKESFGVTWERGYATGQRKKVDFLAYSNVEAWLERMAQAGEAKV